MNRTQAATDAGLSERQRKTALRVANVLAPAFEEQVALPENSVRYAPELQCPWNGPRSPPMRAAASTA